ncbi:MAG TPA: hypothetical protein VMS21_00240, partial [Methylomirabilota bacterium]|nr:hypothetical protein [Methylomirabilota bacterium]
MSSAADNAGADPRHLSPNQRAWRRFRSNRMALGSAFLLALILTLVLLWPILGGRSATDLSAAQFAPPGAEHWFG